MELAVACAAKPSSSAVTSSGLRNDRIAWLGFRLGFGFGLACTSLVRVRVRVTGGSNSAYPNPKPNPNSSPSSSPDRNLNPNPRVGLGCGLLEVGCRRRRPSTSDEANSAYPAHEARG